jgi:hypothetical protein
MDMCSQSGGATSTMFRPDNDGTLMAGGRCLDFSYGLGDETRSVTIEIAPSFLQAGPDRITIQEASGICYEALRARLQAGSPPAQFGITAEEIAQLRSPLPPFGASEDFRWDNNCQGCRYLERLD